MAYDTSRRRLVWWVGAGRGGGGTGGGGLFVQGRRKQESASCVHPCALHPAWCTPHKLLLLLSALLSIAAPPTAPSSGRTAALRWSASMTPAWWRRCTTRPSAWWVGGWSRGCGDACTHLEAVSIAARGSTCSGQCQTDAREGCTCGGSEWFLVRQEATVSIRLSRPCLLFRWKG